MKSEVYVEEALLEVFNETDLVKFQAKLCVDLQLSRLEHFDHVTDDELHLAGLSLPSIRRLRLAIADKRKKIKKSKGIFSTVGKKDGQCMTKVILATDVIPDALPSTSKDVSSTATCLIPKEEIFLAERLGEGSFAVVKRALWKRPDGIKIDVAVKILREPSTEIMEDLQQEVNNMQRLQHPNLIRLYGMVFSNPAMMVVEFCDGGSLIDRLRAVDKPVPLLLTLLDYSLQIAKGMTYLESKHCVHRDLAARNVLLADTDRVVKICDFGLMRVLNENERLYTMSAQKKIPFAWCPPESLRYRQFSRASDVWAFGVTLWELFSYGEEPWVGCRGAEVLTKLEAGERLQRPKRCSAEIYELMSTCWSNNADVRPKFSLLKGLLADTKFTIVECRENFGPEGDLDLELQTNDRIVVIEGSGVIWYGQNIRTRKFGYFRRSAIHLRNERNLNSTIANTDEQAVVNAGIASDGSERISKPIPGSFIHAGHGDINPSQCWGQPERIDDIYLKNPILRKDWELKNGKQKRPKFIPSVVSMQTSGSASCLHVCTPPVSTAEKTSIPQRPNLPNADPVKKSTDTVSVCSSSSVDPFAPFSEYYYDAFDENNFDKSWTSPQQSSSSTKSLYASLGTTNSQAHQVLPSAKSGPIYPSTPISYDLPPLEPTRIYQATSAAVSKYASTESSLKQLRNTAATDRNEPHMPTFPSTDIKFQSTTTATVQKIADSKPSHVIFKTVNSNLTDNKVKKVDVLGYPFRLPPPTALEKSSLQLPSDNNCNESASRLSLCSLSGQKIFPRATDNNLISQRTLAGYDMSASAINKEGCSRVSSSLPLTKAALTVQGDVQKVSAPVKSKTKEQGSISATNFNASRYYAKSSREACGDESQPGNRNTYVSGNKIEELKEDIVTSMLKASNNATAAFRETTFAVNASPATVNAENKDLVQKSAAVSAKVNLATKNALSTCKVSSPPNSLVNSPLSNIAPIVTDGPDPFEISLSVKHIASRGRYSEVFSDMEGASGSQQKQESLLAPFPTSSIKSEKSLTLTSFSNNPLLPPPSPLLLGIREEKQRSSTYGLSASPFLSSLATKDKLSVGLSKNGSVESSLVSQSMVSNIPTQKPVLQSGFAVASMSGVPCGFSSSTANIFTNRFLNKDTTQIFTTSAPYSSAGCNSTNSVASSQALVGPNFNPPYYWHPGQSSFSSVLTPEVSSCAINTRNQKALVYDANASSSPRRPQTSRGFESLLAGETGSKNIGINNCTYSSSALVTEEILGLFDPLSASSSNSDNVNKNKCSYDNKGSTVKTVDQMADLVEAVLKDAVFAGRSKCKIMLQKCGNDVKKAVRELKAEELLAMGLTHDKSVAISTLEDCNWDLNAAASALIA